MIKDVFTTIAINVRPESGIDYIQRSKLLINSVLNLTDKDIIVVTNNTNEYQELINDRLKIYDIEHLTDDKLISGGMFNMHLKRVPISIANKLGYENIMYCDCDTYFDKWDENSYQELLNKDFDIAFKGGGNLEGLLHLPHYNIKVKEMGNLWYDDLKKSTNMAEVFILFKTPVKLLKFIDFWDKISDKNKDFTHNTYYDSFYFGVSMYHSNMKGFNFKLNKTETNSFTENWKIQHGKDSLLNFYGIKI